MLARHPRTDDAAARANVVGIVPRVRGPIVNLAVQDNQLVKQGDLLFEIDPADYEQALIKRNRRFQLSTSKSKWARARRTVEIRSQGRRGWRSKRDCATQTIAGYVAPARAAAAKTFRNGGTSGRGANEGCVAAQEVAANEQKLNTARAQLSQLQTLLAQRPGAVAAVKQAELDLSYCKVSAPFDGRVINLNISAGAYASVGVPVFSFLDTTKWYVMANFREARTSPHGSGKRSDCLSCLRA